MKDYSSPPLDYEPRQSCHRTIAARLARWMAHTASGVMLAAVATVVLLMPWFGLITSLS